MSDTDRLAALLLPHMGRIRGAHNGDEPCDWCRLAAEQAAEACRAAGVHVGDDGALTEHDDPRYRPLMLAVRAADEAFQAAGDAGTKTWLDDYFLPELERHGLTVAALAATPEPPADFGQQLVQRGPLPKGLQRSIDDALNRGDGTYRP